MGIVYDLKPTGMGFYPATAPPEGTCKGENIVKVVQPCPEAVEIHHY
jgi:hypothetical protein